MSGRHHEAMFRRHPRSTLFIAGAAVVALAVIAVLYATFPNHPDAAISKPVRCNGNIALRVAVAPALAAPVRDIAATWSAGHPNADGKCVDVQVSSGPSAKQEHDLATSGGAGTDLWLPESSLWARQLVADQAGLPGDTADVTVNGSVASSPLVMVTSASRAAALARTGAQGIWRQIVAGTLPTTIADPLANTEGLLSLLTVNTLIHRPNATSGLPDLVSVMVRISHATLPTAQIGFDRLAANPRSAPLFTASEQSVIQANAAAHTKFAVAIYPDEGTLSYDFPVVRLAHAGDDPSVATAAAQFDRELRSDNSKARYGRAGLRDASGAPVAGAGLDQGVTQAKTSLLPAPTAAQAGDILRLWSAAITDARTLAVIDVSGSMNEPAGNGQSKIAVASAAAAAAAGFFPGSSNLGLWAFASDQGAGTPWVQLVPMGLMSDRQGGITHRQALVNGALSLPARVHGGTALYDTALAAFQQVRNSYDSARSNSVVLLTDGENDFPPGLTLDALLKRLRTLVDPARPVPIITIGIGSADIKALQAISGATGGKAYLVKKAADIRGVFLDAVAQRRCRPDC